MIIRKELSLNETLGMGNSFKKVVRDIKPISITVSKDTFRNVNTLRGKNNPVYLESRNEIKEISEKNGAVQKFIDNKITQKIFEIVTATSLTSEEVQKVVEFKLNDTTKLINHMKREGDTKDLYQLHIESIKTNTLDTNEDKTFYQLTLTKEFDGNEGKVDKIFEVLLENWNDNFEVSLFKAETTQSELEEDKNRIRESNKLELESLKGSVYTSKLSEQMFNNIVEAIKWTIKNGKRK